VTRLELGRSTATIVVVLALAACSRSSERAAPEGDPVPSTVTDEVVATPARVSAGGLVVLTFPDETFRGVAWELARRDGGETSQGPFLLVAATDAFDCASCPLWYPAGEGGSEDIGISGPGPDLVRIPEVAEAGRWSLCTANAADGPHCTDLEIADPAAEPRPTNDDGSQVTVQVDPDRAVPGQVVELTFPTGVLRGTSWAFGRAEGDEGLATM